MAKYILKSEALRVVTHNEKGNVNYRRRYKRGQEVDVSKIEDAQVEALLRTGRLVLDTEEPTDEAEAALAAEAARVIAASSPGTAGDLGSTATQTDQDEEAEGDRYTNMSYSDLQAEAKQRTGNGGGSADDLRDRLREADKEDSDEESEDEDDEA